jgi:hypothetical protein
MSIAPHFFGSGGRPLEKKKRKKGEGKGKEGGKKIKKKEKGIETVQLIMQYPSSEKNDFGILVLDDGLFMLHCRHHERQTPSPAETVLGPYGVGTGRRRHQIHPESELESKLGFDQFS